MRFTIAFVRRCITNTQSKSARVRTRPEGAFSLSVCGGARVSSNRVSMCKSKSKDPTRGFALFSLFLNYKSHLFHITIKHPDDSPINQDANPSVVVFHSSLLSFPLLWRSITRLFELVWVLQTVREKIKSVSESHYCLMLMQAGNIRQQIPPVQKPAIISRL